MALTNYQSYKTGLYSVNGGTKRPGLYLLLSVIGKPQQSAYCLFNAESSYNRNTAKHRAGDPLPKGQFRVKHGSKFTGLWLACGLPLPDGGKLSCFHRYMGKLSGIVLTGTPTPDKSERLATLTPATVNHSTIQAAYEQTKTTSSVPKLSLICPYDVPNMSLRAVPKETEPDQQSRALEADSGTGQNSANKGKQVKVNHNAFIAVKEGSLIPSNEQPPAPGNSDADDWLADYEAAHRA